MKRTLILISNSGTDDNPAAGTVKDILDYKRFFMSDNGGAWEENTEIVEYKSSEDQIQLTWSLLESCIEYRNDSEYFMIVFCGHGEAKPNGQTVLELSPGNECRLIDIINSLGNVKFTIILDSCRGVEMLREGGTHPRRLLFSETDDRSPYRGLCRKYYDLAIQCASPCNGVICYSASFRQSAIDLGKKLGGLFSQSLLTNCLSFKNQLEQHVNSKGLEFGMVTIEDCMGRVAADVTRKSGGKQVPEIEARNGVVDFPFIICPNWQLQI